MKKIIFTLLFFQSIFTVAQSSDVNQIKADSKAFFKALETLDYEHFMEMTYPSVFEVYDKETFKASMKEAFQGNEEIRLEFVDLSDTEVSISRVYELDNPKTKYAFVTYPTKMKMIFHNQTFDESMQEMMKMMMETDLMKIEFLNNNTLLMNQKSMMIAVFDSKTNSKWKYLNFETEMDMDAFLPEKVIKDANNHFQAYLNGN